jgi:hypothetical protein
MKANIMFLCLIINTMALFSQDYSDFLSMPYYYTTISDDNVNVRDAPNLSGNIHKKLNRDEKIILIDISDEAIRIDGTLCYWFKIKLYTEPNSSSLGWVFGKYINGGTHIKKAKLQYKSFTESTKISASSLKLILTVDGNSHEETVFPYFEKGKGYYSFVYENNAREYNLWKINGSYIFYPNSKEIKYISFLGTTTESAWVRFSNDFKYLFEDFGTSSGVRGLGVWNINSNQLVFNGSYYSDIDIDDNSILIVYRYSEYEVKNRIIDQEIIDYAKKNINRKIYINQDGIAENVPIVVCRLNLNTKERTVIGIKYITEQ